MTNTIDPTLGLGLFCLVVGLPCAWAAWRLIKEIRERLETGTAVDRTLSKVYKEDAPGMFWMQIVGMFLLAGFCISSVIGSVVGFITAFVRLLILDR